MGRKISTIIWRHRKERLSKCSLHGLEGREEIQFFSYPDEKLPEMEGFVLLAPDGDPLQSAEGILLLDGTWRYAAKMEAAAPNLPHRSLPGWKTAYPRRQDEKAGLASVEALFAAYHILGWDEGGLLDHYHWKERFLEINHHNL